MIQSHLKKYALMLLILAMLGNITLYAQHPWQKPLPPKERSVIEKIIGPVQQKEPSRDLHIVLVWGEDLDHEKGYHEYERFKDLWMCSLEGRSPSNRGSGLSVSLKRAVEQNRSGGFLCAFGFPGS